MKKRKYSVTKHEGQRIRHLGPNSFMADYNRDGERARVCFKTIEEAQAFIRAKNIEAKNRGRAAFNLSDRDRLELVELRGKLGKAVTLAELAAFWEKHHPAVGEPITVEAMVEDFLSSNGRKGSKPVQRREATTDGHRKRLLPFIETFGTRLAYDVTQADVEQWLDVKGWLGRNRLHYLAAVRAMYNHGLRKGFVTMNPAEKIETPAIEAAPPAIMSPADVGKYLNTIYVNHPTLLPRETLSFFCGLRPDEAARLDWQNVNLEGKTVTIGTGVAKMRRQRHVDMPDCLIKWLAPFARLSGPLWPFSQSALFKARREASKTARVKLPPNAGRHAFASYHLRLHDNAPLTAEAMGHAKPDLLKTIYRNINTADGGKITKATATEYFNILPKQDAKIIPIRKAG